MKQTMGWLVLLLLGLVGSLSAQSVLIVEHKGKAAVVKAVRKGWPVVEVDGKSVSVSPKSRSLLTDAQEYFPFFISVRDLEVKNTARTLNVGMGGSGEINNRFDFKAGFESLFPLKDVFLVLELTAATGKYIFYYEVGELRPREPRHVEVRVPLSFSVGPGKYKLHLFTEGGEVLHSEMPPLFRDQVLDRMVRRRIEGVKDAPLRPFVGPAPEYPRALLGTKTSGTATVRFRITNTGATLDPEVVSATAPEFGETAQAAVRLWRFLPSVKDGHAVEGRAELPFSFTPPVEGK